MQGIPKLFITRFGPADYAEAVNTLGLPLYAKSHMLPFNRGAMIEAQSNPVNLCSIPRAVIKLTILIDPTARRNRRAVPESKDEFHEKELV